MKLKAVYSGAIQLSVGGCFRLLTQFWTYLTFDLNFSPSRSLASIKNLHFFFFYIFFEMYSKTCTVCKSKEGVFFFRSQVIFISKVHRSSLKYDMIIIKYHVLQGSEKICLQMYPLCCISALQWYVLQNELNKHKLCWIFTGNKCTCISAIDSEFFKIWSDITIEKIIHFKSYKNICTVLLLCVYKELWAITYLTS